MATYSGRPSTITPEPTPQSTHIIPSDEDSISSQPPLPPSIDIYCLPQPLTKVPPTEPSDATLNNNSIEPLSIRTLNLVHRYATNLPPLHLSSTPAPCDNQKQFESLNLHHIFGCRQVRNQRHLPTATNPSLVNSGLLPSTIVSFAAISNPPKGKTIKKRRQYLDKVRIDIVFDDRVALGGHQYVLLLVDVATRYCWLYRMSSLSSTSITSATEQFKSDAGRLSHWFHSNSDRKSIGGNDLQWILLNGSNIITAPDERQSSNGLAKHT